jgi:hypothetical protein
MIWKSFFFFAFENMDWNLEIFILHGLTAAVRPGGSNNRKFKPQSALRAKTSEAGALETSICDLQNQPTFVTATGGSGQGPIAANAIENDVGNTNSYTSNNTRPGQGMQNNQIPIKQARP